MLWQRIDIVLIRVDCIVKLNWLRLPARKANNVTIHSRTSRKWNIKSQNSIRSPLKRSNCMTIENITTQGSYERCCWSIYESPTGTSYYCISIICEFTWYVFLFFLFTQMDVICTVAEMKPFKFIALSISIDIKLLWFE